ncbi:hypothetical protein SUGI_0932180 [Cryptomeria japonica]|uniref:trihelix transcription factor ASR3 n=1 Tax=Cryptomeria japonica TaxID=3369 RepID=UPI0024149644|nr:trihelix transcription factor ASR3 [Cryptomeria japonica]XP_057865535.1 trihelix transcription factor ASR3 [Cryptomeria japonica]GLJ44440.1 hypothetical protein SUGI_0932180 [Cryptomeria japonica]
MLSQSFSNSVCTQVGSEATYALSIPHNHEVTTAEVHDAIPLSELQTTVQKKQPKGRVRWTIEETLTLINAKEVEKNLPSPGGFMKQTKSAIEKWRNTSVQCYSNGLNRTATQCRDRWDHIQPDYKKIRHYERSILSEQESYWNMTTKERIDKKLPANFTREIFDAMEKHFGQNRTVHPGDMVIDTSASDYGALEEHDAVAGSIPLQKNTKLETPFENGGDASIDTENQFAGKKRKANPATTGIRSTLTENNRQTISYLKVAEQGHIKRHEKYCSMVEQQMEIDEKYLKDHTLNVQRMIYVEERKVKAQQELITALNNIGQAMLKIWSFINSVLFQPEACVDYKCH